MARWAYDAGILEGIGSGGSLGANGDAPRGETALMLYNYAKYMGCSLGTSADLGGFTDAGSVSPGTLEAMRWAVGAGLINGMGDGTLNPGGGTTRAQIAALFMRLCERVLD